MINEKFFLGYPINFKNKCSVYPPKIKEIVETTNFPVYKKILTLSQEEVEDDFVEREMDLKELLTPLEYLLNNACNSKEIEKLTKEAFQFFIKEEITFLYDQKIIIIGDLAQTLKKIKDISELVMIGEEDFFDFQNIIRESIGENPKETPVENENPRLKAMKAKARYRDKIKAKSGKGLNFASSLVSICCMEFGLNPLNIGELSYAAIHPLIQQFQEKEKYELDIKSLLAGGDSKKIKPKYWVRNIEE